METSNKLINFIKEKRLSDFKKQLDEIYEYIARIEDVADAALAQVRDWNRDTEIQKLQEEIQTLKSKIHSDFTLTQDEHDNIRSWQSTHREAKHKNKKYSYWSYTFTPTGLGLVGCCKCNECNEEFMFREP